MSYKFKSTDYTEPYNLDRSELLELVGKFIRPEYTEISDQLDRRPVCVDIEYFWRWDNNGNKLEFSIVKMIDGSHIAIVGKHLKSYVSCIESYTGIDCVEFGNMKAKPWHEELRNAVDINPLFVVNAHKQPL